MLIFVGDDQRSHLNDNILFIDVGSLYVTGALICRSFLLADKNLSLDNVGEEYALSDFVLLPASRLKNVIWKELKG